MTFISYAQNYEDIMIWRAFKDIKNGFYVDVGANDPVLFSVTQAFYERGWHGINIEPMRSYYERLCSERPLDINLPFAAADEERELVFYEIPETGLSTIDGEVAEQERIAGWKVIEKKVQALTLNQIFEQYVNSPIHFLKVDVEGAERTVLQGLDLTRWRPWILVVEATVPLSEELNYESWECSVLAAEYDMVYFDGLNRFYLAFEHPELAESFKTPPNIFDDFMPFRYKNSLDGIQGELNKVVADRDRIQNELNGVAADRDRIRNELNRIQNELNRVAAELSDIHYTFSWRITRPLRQLKEGIRYLQRLYETRIKSGLIKLAISRLASMVYQRPKLKHILFLMVHNFPRIENRMRKIVDASNDQTPDILKSKLSERAQIIYYDLRGAIQKRNSRK